MWKPGDTVMWRGILMERVWHVQPTIVVQDSPDELALTLIPGTECLAEETYPLGKEKSKRWWDFKDYDWTLKTYTWRTNRLLLVLEPDTYYSTIYFWDHVSNEFLCYYINFQIPFKRNHSSIDTLDLELDLIIKPDFTHEWKDVEDYQMAIKHGIISPEYMREIDSAKPKIFSDLENREYPFDGSWLSWKPDSNWLPPKLPENWDKI
jgi:protein associated with RNAse G/E